MLSVFTKVKKYIHDLESYTMLKINRHYHDLITTDMCS